MELLTELLLLALGILMMSYAVFFAFAVSRMARKTESAEEKTAKSWLLASAALTFPAGVAFVAAAAFPATRPYSLWAGVALMLADSVRRIIFRRRLKKRERVERAD